MTMVTLSASEIAKQVRGVTYSKGDAIGTPSPGYVMLLRANNITSDGLTTDGAIYIPESKVSQKQRLLPGDIVVATSSGSLDVVGKASPVTGPINATFGAFCKVVRPNKKVAPEYLAQFFKSSSYRQTVSKLAAGVNINNLRNEHIDDLQVPLPHKNGEPDLDEQKRIAAILDKADALRRKRQQALRLTDDFLRSVFLDMFGDPVTNPKGWESRDLNYVIGNSFRNGLSPSSKGNVAGKVLTLTAITTGSFSPEYARDSFFDRAPSENQLVTSDTFLICRGNGNKKMVGIGVFPEADMSGVAFPDTMIACTVDRTLIEPDYLQNLWSTAHIRTQIEAGARTTNGTYKVNQTLLGGVAFPLPPVSLQREFSTIAKSLRSKAQKSALAADSSEELFSSLQQRAFRGEL